MAKSNRVSKILTAKEVKQVIATRGLSGLRGGPNEFLDDVNAIEDAAAVLLAKHNAFLPLNRLRQLSVAAAKALARTKSHLCLDGLTSITPELAEALANRPKDSQSLSLNGLTTITIDEARTLARVACYRLELGLTSLPVAIAEALGQREGSLMLDKLTKISDAAAESLSKHEGNLYLNGLTSLSDSAAESLSKHEGNLYLNGLTSLSDSAAESLSKHEGCLGLYGLTRLSQVACVILSKKLDGYDYSPDPMKPGSQYLEEERSDVEVARDQLFFLHLFTDRAEARDKKIRNYCESPNGKAAIKKVEALIDADPQSRQLNYVECSSMSVEAAVKLASHGNGIRCPGFIGFSNAEKDGHDWHALGDALVRFLQKVPGHGPRCKVLGGLLIEHMLASGQTKALGQLLRVAREIKKTDTRRWIETRVAWRAQETGTSTQAIEDATIEAHGFGDLKNKPARSATRARGSEGSKIQETMKGRKRIEVDGVGTVEISVLTGTAECFIREKEHRKPLDLKGLRKTNKVAAAFLSDEVKTIEDTLCDSKRRLESSWCSAGTWAWKDLQRCWFEHPLVFPIAERLIWRFEGAKGIQEGLWEESGFTDSKGKALGKIAADTRVSLWHPAHSPATVDAWRRRLLEVGIEQPFRQVFREVYLVTDAEKSDGSRSARFAGHILRQAQFAALCRERGWSVSLVGPFDSDSSAEKQITNHNVHVCWDGDPVGTETSGTFYRLIRMNTVRFKPVIADISSIVFSEVLRDLDLFVSVASIGVDPLWNDAYPDPECQAYLSSFTSGDLTESGRMRREVLELMFSRLPESGRFSLEKKHLVVQGSLGAYAIHLQSGAVFKQPGNRHVCIVPKVDPMANPMKRLVGDPMLSLIMSKALLLAKDDKIKDRSILSQIK